MELTAITAQEVAVNQNVLFTDTAVEGNCSIWHRDGSGLVTLRGLTNQCRARFKVSFNGNIGVPTGGVVGAISLAIAINGEPVGATQMLTYPAAVLEYQNVGASTYIDVPAGCCSIISVENTSTTAIDVQNANLIVERTA